jgi:hypothetical protein
MPTTKDEAAVNMADSDAFTGLIVMQSETYCSTTLRDCFILRLFISRGNLGLRMYLH